MLLVATCYRGAPVPRKGSHRMTTRSEAEALIAWGLEILPARAGHPVVSEWQQPRSPVACHDLWAKHPRASQAAAVMARSSLLVVDLDSDEGVAAWRSALPKSLGLNPAISLTSGPKKGRTGRGMHLWFRRPVDFPVQDFLRGDLGFDLRAFGVILVPPTKSHKDGTIYEWQRPLPAAPELLPLFPHELPAIQALLAPSSGTKARPIGRSHSGLPTLDDLIAHPPVVGTRDAVLISTMGRFARQAWPRLEYARGEAERVAAAICGGDMDESDVLERFERAWAYEDAKRTDVGQALGIDTDPEQMITTLEVSVGDKDHRSSERRCWLPWVISDARMVYDPVENEYTWEIQARRRAGLTTEERRAHVPSWRFSSNRDMERALNAAQLPVYSPGRPSKDPNLEARHRMERMLMSMFPTQWVQVPPGLWSAHDLRERYGFESPYPYLFVSQEVMLDPQGRPIPAHDHLGNPTIPLLSRSDKAKFPMVIERKEALEGWRDLCTFHFPEAMAPLAALTIMLPLKPLLVGRAFFPFLAVTGQAGAGKSNSALGRLVAASGMQIGTGRITAAGAKRMMGESRAGWLWVDDIEDPGALAEILRQVTDERTMSQAISGTSKAMNHFPLLQMPLLTGETLGSLEGERALEERAVHVELSGMVKDRMSLIDPSRKQWDDIEAWDRRFGGGSLLAGPLVSAVLDAVGRHPDATHWLYDQLKALGSISDSSDRLALKEGTLQFGVRLATWLARGMPDDEADVWYRPEYAAAIHSEVNLIEALAARAPDRIQHDASGRVVRRTSNVMRVICEFLAGLNSYDQAYILPKRGTGEKAMDHLIVTPVKVRISYDRDPIVFVYLPGLVAWAKQQKGPGAGHRVVSKTNWERELEERGWDRPTNPDQRFRARVWRATPEDSLRILHEVNYEFPAEARMPTLPSAPEGHLFPAGKESDEWG